MSESNSNSFQWL